MPRTGSGKGRNGAGGMPRHCAAPGGTTLASSRSTAAGAEAMTLRAMRAWLRGSCRAGVPTVRSRCLPA